MIVLCRYVTVQGLGLLTSHVPIFAGLDRLEIPVPGIASMRKKRAPSAHSWGASVLASRWRRNFLRNLTGPNGVAKLPATTLFNLTESPWIRVGVQYSVRDLWVHSDNGTAVRNFTAHDVPLHGVVALLLQDTRDEPEGSWPPCAVAEWCISQSGVGID
ncbi:hypothetical protein BKA83DRAFT_4125996 [Pisolithus microcarpus]|nr:hypothetical protein BKA83DRAFT_4125996 [Pisolithus microcarpus]